MSQAIAINPTDTLVGTPLERVETVRDIIVKAGNEAQELRRCPQPEIDKLIDAGFFRFTLPPELGGENASIRETIEVLEAMAAIDASDAWNVMLGSEINAMAAGGMPKHLAKEVYIDNPRVVMCGGGGPGTTPSKAVKQKDGGYKVWGQTTFISGCHNAEWCFMAAAVFEGDEMVVDKNGVPTFKMWFLNRKEYEILDTWDVSALRGSGSHDVKADGAYVPEKFVDVDLMVVPPLYDNPVFRVPTPMRLAYNKSAIAIGVARGAIDAFIGLANHKVPMLSPSKLMDRPIAQHRLAEQEAKLRAARAFLFEAMAEMEEELEVGADAPGPHTTQNGRLACIYASNACMEVVDLIHQTAGTSAAYMKNPLERKLRDAHGCASHRWVSHSLYGELGSIMMGHEASPEFAGTQNALRTS